MIPTKFSNPWTPKPNFGTCVRGSGGTVSDMTTMTIPPSWRAHVSKFGFGVRFEKNDMYHIVPSRIMSVEYPTSVDTKC